MTLTFTDALAQTISAERAAGFVKSGMWLDYGTSLCQPDIFDKALGARVHEVTNVKIRVKRRAFITLLGAAVWPLAERCAHCLTASVGVTLRDVAEPSEV